jgi:methionyl-tRNA synthetase
MNAITETAFNHDLTSRRKTYYVTTPIYYVNGDPHIGHAYTSIAADVLARWNRLMGKNVFFLTGTDEHGQKVEQAAAKAGVKTQDFVDAVSGKFQEMNRILRISNDAFIRTTNTEHKQLCQDIWRQLEDAGHIYLGQYQGWYCTRDECYYTKNEVYTVLNGDCVSIDTGNICEWLTEPCYFFRLSNFRDRILTKLKDDPSFVAPTSARNEVIALLRSEDLQDVCISRTTFTWGIDVPDHEGHVMYVWIDALMNYLTAPHIFEKDFWPPDVHLVGKEITRFHAIIWPALLMALDWPLPKRIFAHGWWTAEGAKMGKSVGNVIDPIVLARKYGVDRVRYYLLREMPFGNDGDFTYEHLVRRSNSELANDLGNLAQRTLSIIANKRNGADPTIAAHWHPDTSLIEKIDEALSTQDFTVALDAIWKVIRNGNAYISEKEPWKVIDSDPAAADIILANLVTTLRNVAYVLEPFMPDSMAALTEQLTAENGVLPKPTPIFPRV